MYYYESFIHMVISQFLKNSNDCEDLRQLILVKLWKKLKNYDDSKSKFRTWLSRVIRNTVLNYIRDNSKAKSMLVTENENMLDPACENVLLSYIQSEWETYATNLALERIRPLFSEKAMEVFSLSLDNISVKQIAETLGISPESVYKMKTRTVNRLKEEIKAIREDTEF